MAKDNRGGARSNAGRKPLQDKKRSLFLWLPGSLIDLLGEDKAKQVGEAAVTRAAKKMQAK